MCKSLLVAALVAFGLWSAMPAMAQAPCQTTSNLVANCGFQTGDFTSWTTSGNTANPGSNYYGVDNFDALPSSYGAGTYTYGAYMSNDLIAGTGTVNLSQTLATVAGQTYQIIFWLEDYTAATTGYTQTFTAMWGATTLVSLTNPTSGGTWTEYTFDETATGASTLLEFLFENDDSYWAFDAVSVTQTPEGPTGILAAMGLCALLLLRRRCPVA